MEPLNEIAVGELELVNHSTLFVFALESEEAGEFEGLNKLLVGVGKVNAAYHLTKAIAQKKPGLIVNLGSAGSDFFQTGEVVCCTRFVQRDMDGRGLGFAPYQTPFSDTPPVLDYGIKISGLKEGICGTGDHFETNHFCPDYNVVDMEAYSLALIAQREAIPFLCLKYISDGANGAAADDWTEQVHKAASAFKRILF